MGEGAVRGLAPALAPRGRPGPVRTIPPGPGRPRSAPRRPLSLGAARPDPPPLSLPLTVS